MNPVQITNKRELLASCDGANPFTDARVLDLFLSLHSEFLPDVDFFEKPLFAVGMPSGTFIFKVEGRRDGEGYGVSGLSDYMNVPSSSYTVDDVAEAARLASSYAYERYKDAIWLGLDPLRNVGDSKYSFGFESPVCNLNGVSNEEDLSASLSRNARANLRKCKKYSSCCVAPDDVLPSLLRFCSKWEDDEYTYAVQQILFNYACSQFYPSYVVGAADGDGNLVGLQICLYSDGVSTAAAFGAASLPSVASYITYLSAMKALELGCLTYDPGAVVRMEEADVGGYAQYKRVVCNDTLMRYVITACYGHDILPPYCNNGVWEF